MFERQEVAAVIVVVGLGLLLFSVLGWGSVSVVNIVAGALGLFLVAAGIVWWQMLRRR